MSLENRNQICGPPLFESRFVSQYLRPDQREAGLRLGLEVFFVFPFIGRFCFDAGLSALLQGRPTGVGPLWHAEVAPRIRLMRFSVLGNSRTISVWPLAWQLRPAYRFAIATNRPS